MMMALLASFFPRGCIEPVVLWNSWIRIPLKIWFLLTKFWGPDHTRWTYLVSMHPTRKRRYRIIFCCLKIPLLLVVNNIKFSPLLNVTLRTGASHCCMPANMRQTCDFKEANYFSARMSAETWKNLTILKKMSVNVCFHSREEEACTTLIGTREVSKLCICCQRLLEGERFQ